MPPTYRPIEVPPTTPAWMRRGHAIARAAGRVEDALAMFAGLCIASALGFVAVMSPFDWRDLPTAARPLTVVLSALALSLNGPYVFRLFRALLRHEHPLALAVAERQWVPPRPLRLIVVLWWAAHFAAATAVALAAQVAHDDGGRTDHPPPPFVMPVVTFAMATAVGFAANGFLIAAVCAATRSARVRHAVWRARVGVDVGLAVVGTAIAVFNRR